ncbi:MAG TPA: EAL domain-containing protein [Rhodanobacteraceae bacterium]|nr:EAL domain-containing protein [Rhodanobacteraceae bacterium]
MPGQDTPALLIVAADRGERRILYDALEQAGFETLYTARDATQARALLAQIPALDLVLLEFSGEAGEAVTLCAQLAGRQGPAVLGLLAGEAAQRVWGFHRAVPGVSDWLAAPFAAGEVCARVNSALGRRPAVVGSGEADDALRLFFDTSDDELLVSAGDGRIIACNAAFARASGLTGAAWRGHSPDLITLCAGAEYQQALLRQLQREGAVQFRGERPRADGRSDPVEISMRLALHDGAPVYCSRIRTLDDQRRARDALALLARINAAGRGDAALETALHLLADALDLDFVAVYAAAADGAALPLAVVQRGPAPADAPDPAQQATLTLALAGEEVMHLDGAHRLAAVDGFLAAIAAAACACLPLTDPHGNVLGALLACACTPRGADVLLADTLRVAAGRFAAELALRRAREQGRARGLEDALTGLPNRLLFNDRLHNVLLEAERSGESFAVLFVDLDRFKSINDALGHATGDQVLLAAGRRLRGSVRAYDTVARYAGDEFTVILRQIVQRDDVHRIADKIVRLMEAPLALPDGSEIAVTASIGLSVYPDDATSAEQLLQHADMAMYSAKGLGRNTWQAYVAMPQEAHRQRVALEGRLRQAERNGELRLHYQPQVEAASEDIVGMEALIRWEHPDLGMISPAFFIPLAEETGLILPIGEWVLRTACADAVRWQHRFGLGLRVGVNLSVLQLRHPGLVDTVRAVLAESGIDPGQLELEVTESVSLKSAGGLPEALQALRALGCRIAIDDFGTGQASLDYLRRFPADRIKIDQSFVRHIGVDPDDEAIVRATVSMAHSLGRAVVAEGVETEQQFEFLRALGCEELQGYLFCRPLAHEAFERLLATRAQLHPAPAAPGR